MNHVVEAYHYLITYENLGLSTLEEEDFCRRLNVCLQEDCEIFMTRNINWHFDLLVTSPARTFIRVYLAFLIELIARDAINLVISREGMTIMQQDIKDAIALRFN